MVIVSQKTQSGAKQEASKEWLSQKALEHHRGEKVRGEADVQIKKNEPGKEREGDRERKRKKKTLQYIHTGTKSAP